MKDRLTGRWNHKKGHGDLNRGLFSFIKIFHLFSVTNSQEIKAMNISEDIGTKLLFENDRVRVWDLALAPGESTGMHRHENDYIVRGYR